jgi:Flp pilus assembly protein TadD
MKNRLIHLLGSLLCLSLLGCASAPPAAQPSDAVFRDALFAAPSPKPDAGALFALTPAMKRYLAEQIEPQVRRKGAQMALLDALYTQGELRLEYDAQRTRTAAEAFDARMGNCLSLVIMTAAFAQEMNLHVRFQDVLGAPAVEQNGAFTFVVGHVNLAMSRGLGTRPGLAESDWLIVDFVPGEDLRRQRTRAIDQRRVAAMYMNNRAAEELALGRVDQAYWWLRGAFEQDPQFPSLYNTLGVVYRHRGALAEAEQALQLARALQPDDEHVTSNLAGVLRLQGREAAAVQLAASGQAPRAQSSNGRFDPARAALDAGQLKQALRLLQGELGLTPRNAELHYWLAVTAARLGDAAGARRHLELATEYSGSGEQHALYAGKLQRLKEHSSSLPSGSH